MVVLKSDLTFARSHIASSVSSFIYSEMVGTTETDWNGSCK